MDTTIDYGPNISSDSSNFFQSDRDLELSRQREEKAKGVGANAGNPIQLPSKVLGFTVVQDWAAWGIEGEVKAEEKVLAYVAESGHVARKIDLKTGKVLKIFKGHTGPVTSVAVVYGSSTGKEEFLITGSWDKTAKKWDIETKECVQTFTGHTDFVKCLLVYKSFLFTGSSDKTIRQWDLSTGKELQVFKGHTRGIECLILHPYGDESNPGRFIISASSDTTIKMWDTVTGQATRTFAGHQTSVYGLLLVEGSLWSTSADNTAKRWDLETGQSDCSLEHSDFVKCIQISGGYAFTGSRDENISVWDIAKEKCVGIIEGHFGEVSCMQLVGTTLYTASLDCTIRSWSVKENDLLEIGKAPAITDEAVAPTTTISTAASTTGKKKKGADDKAAGITAAVQSLELTEDEERELAELMGDDDL